MNILDKIVLHKKGDVESRKQKVSIEELEKMEGFARKTISLKSKLLNKAGVIAEFKRKSPSKGIINDHFSSVEITTAYEQAGASAVSILTDTEFFGGADKDLTLARPHLSIPILRKDFMIDPYQIIESKALGADIILLIAACLSISETKILAQKAKSLGLEVLLEVHNEEELGHVNEYVDMVGVNNRDLKSFEVSIENSIRLAEKIPTDFVKISESGLDAISTIQMLIQSGYRGFLMGEYFMKQENPTLAAKDFIGLLR